jgi:thiamine phosphate synthase YjbQ (UPF0047 family)
MHTLTPVSACRHTTTIQITTTQATQFIDLTDRLKGLVADADLRFGIVNVQNPSYHHGHHRQRALSPCCWPTFQALLEAVAPGARRYEH